MNLHTIRFIIALALSVGLTLVAVGQGSPSCASLATAPSHKTTVVREYAPPLATAATVGGTRPSQTWRSLLPGSMR